MEKIELTKRGRKILFLLKEKKYTPLNEDSEELNLLAEEGLGNGTRRFDQTFVDFKLTDKGRAYLLSNPKLKGPSIWDDKKYWITTGFTFVALALSIYATFFK